MSLLHALAAHHHGHVSGQQSSQRDWSPLLVHFTNWQAMAPLRRAIATTRTPADISGMFETADELSFDVVSQILDSRTIRRGVPGASSDIPACVCLSECTLPGIFSHCERYGRFGFAFEKPQIYRIGGRPCLYLAEREYGFIADQGRGRDPIDDPAGHLFALSNVYVPPKTTGKTQDYTHEREWRLFDTLNLDAIAPAAILAPASYVARIQARALGIPVIPVDTLFNWGA